MPDNAPPPCPECGRNSAIPIVYGLPNKDIIEKAKRHEVVLGGCFVTEDHPQWHCSVFAVSDCGTMRGIRC